MQNPHYQTSDTALATTLATLGVPFATDAEGRPDPAHNVYDPGLLKKMGYIGWRAIEAARDAHSKKRPGVVTYNFVRTATLEAVVKAWDTRMSQIKSNDYGETAALPPVEVEPDQAAIFAAQLWKNRHDIISGWQRARAFLCVPGETATANDPHRPGGKVVTGSAKMVSLNASEALLQTLKL